MVLSIKVKYFKKLYFNSSNVFETKMYINITWLSVFFENTRISLCFKGCGKGYEKILILYT